jgi:uncharacterized protein (TIGR02611 family)
MSIEQRPHPSGDLRARLRAAALEAERGTGSRESSDRQARRHILARIGIIVIGTIVLLAGLLMLILPGPGVVAVLAGLGILAQELPWAERIMERVKEKAHVDQLKASPAWVRVVLVVATVVGVAASVMYVLQR